MVCMLLRLARGRFSDFSGWQPAIGLMGNLRKKEHRKGV